MRQNESKEIRSKIDCLDSLNEIRKKRAKQNIVCIFKVVTNFNDFIHLHFRFNFIAFYNES